MPDFVTVQIDTAPDALLDSGIDQINSTLEANGYPGWTANDTTLAVIILGVIAQIAADVASVAATAVPGIFRAFGTRLLGIPFQQGASAQIVTNWTFTNPAPSTGYSIAGGTSVVIAGFAFYVQNDVTTAASATSQQITLVAAQAGTTYNDLGGLNVQADLVNSIDWVASVTTLGISSGGADQESDEEYQNKLANVLTTIAPRPITTTNFADFVLSDLAEQATSVAAGRATAIDAYYPDGRLLSTGGAGSTAVGCATTSGSQIVYVVAPNLNQTVTPGATVTGTGVPAATFTANTIIATANLSSLSSTAGVGPGTLIAGAGIPAGTSILSVDTGASTAVMSAPATATATGITVTPTQTVLPSPVPTDSAFSITVPASATGAPTLTVSSMTGYGPPHLSGACNLSSGSPIVVMTTAPYTGAIPEAGARVTGANIPNGTTVLASPAPSTSSFTVSANASGNAIGQPVTVSSWTNVARCTTTFATDVGGNPLSAGSMDALQTWLAGYREITFNAFVTAPSYTTIYVTVQIHVLPAFDATAVAASVQTALLSFLSQATWGNPNLVSSGSQAWLNSGQGFNVVRVNSLIGIAEAVPGVQYVPSGGLLLGTSPTPTGTVDLTLTGPAPLPLSSASDVLVTTV